MERLAAPGNQSRQRPAASRKCIWVCARFFPRAKHNTIMYFPFNSEHQIVAAPTVEPNRANCYVIGRWIYDFISPTKGLFFDFLKVTALIETTGAIKNSHLTCSNLHCLLHLRENVCLRLLLLAIPLWCHKGQQILPYYNASFSPAGWSFFLKTTSSFCSFSSPPNKCERSDRVKPFTATLETFWPRSANMWFLATPDWNLTALWSLNSHKSHETDLTPFKGVVSFGIWQDASHCGQIQTAHNVALRNTSRERRWRCGAVTSQSRQKQ